MIAYVQSNAAEYGSSASARTIAFSGNVTAGNTLMLAVSIYASATATVSVADNLNGSWTQAGSYATQGNGRASLWYFPNTAGGACTITVTPSVAEYQTFACAEYSGIKTTSPVDSTSTGSGNGVAGIASTGTVTVSGGSEFVVAAVSYELARPLLIAGPSCGFRAIADTSSNMNVALLDRPSDASAAVSMSISGNWSAVGASFIPTTPASSGGGLPVIGSAIVRAA